MAKKKLVDVCVRCLGYGYIGGYNKDKEYEIATICPVCKGKGSVKVDIEKSVYERALEKRIENIENCIMSVILCSPHFSYASRLEFGDAVLRLRKRSLAKKEVI